MPSELHLNPYNCAITRVEKLLTTSCCVDDEETAEEYFLFAMAVSSEWNFPTMVRQQIADTARQNALAFLGTEYLDEESGSS